MLLLFVRSPARRLAIKSNAGEEPGLRRRSPSPPPARKQSMCREAIKLAIAAFFAFPPDRRAASNASSPAIPAAHPRHWTVSARQGVCDPQCPSETGEVVQGRLLTTDASGQQDRAPASGAGSWLRQENKGLASNDNPLRFW
jgi:hypothetical protein